MNKHIPSFDEFLNESIKWYDLSFNSHGDHNPECDILEGHIVRDTLITYGIYVKGPKTGQEFMEYYSGPNYKPETTKKKSSSRMYTPDKIPAKYQNAWNELRSIYQSDYKGSLVSTRNR